MLLDRFQCLGVKLKENFKVESPNDSTESFLTCITNFTVLV